MIKLDGTIKKARLSRIVALMLTFVMLFTLTSSVLPKLVQNTSALPSGPNYLSKRAQANTYTDYHTEMMAKFDEFTWATYQSAGGKIPDSVPAWDGGLCTHSDDANASTDPTAYPAIANGTYEIWFCSQLLYAVGQIADVGIKLMADLNFNGDVYDATPAKRNRRIGVSIDGNGFTIYNYSGKTGLMPDVHYGSIKDLNFDSWLIVGYDQTAYTNAAMFDVLKGTTIENIYVSNSFTACTATGGNVSHSDGFLIGDLGGAGNFAPSADEIAAMDSPNASHAKNIVIDNCTYTAGGAYHGENNIGHTGILVSTITSMSTLDRCVVTSSTCFLKGGHLGFFAGCNPGPKSITNCVADGDLYTTDGGDYNNAGHFMSSCMPFTLVENCFSVGRIMGPDLCAGFITNAGGQVRNSYSAVHVNQEKTLAGSSCFSTGAQSGTSFENCYAVGELGDVKSDPQSNYPYFTNGTSDITNTGGFFEKYNNNASCTNCYYDKQSTGAREVQADGHIDDSASAIPGVEGVLTTATTKDGAGLTSAPGATGFTGFTDNSEWVFETDRYPQLAVFANVTVSEWFGKTREQMLAEGFNTDYVDRAIAHWQDTVDLIRALSKASTAAVILQPWDTDYKGNQLPRYTYDTVKNMVNSGQMSATSETVASSTSSPTRFLENYTALIIPQRDVFLDQTLSENCIQYDVKKPVTMATDHNDESYCAAYITTNDNYLKADLSAVTELSFMRFYFQYVFHSGENVLGLYIEISDDDITYTEVARVTEIQTGETSIPFSAGTAARYVRICFIKPAVSYPVQARISSVELYDRAAPIFCGYEYLEKKNAIASSEASSPGYNANAALGPDSVGWHSAIADPAPFVTANIGHSVPIDKISFVPQSNLTNYVVAISDDNITWVTVDSGAFLGLDTKKDISLPSGTTGQYIRISADGTASYMGIKNFIALSDSTSSIPFVGTDTNTAISRDHWLACGVNNNVILKNGTGSTSQVFGSTEPVTDIVYNGTGNITFTTRPGVDWVKDTVEVGNVSATKYIRIAPATALKAGADKSITSTSETYDHANDMRMAYTTVPRYLASITDFTTGVYPDVALETAQYTLLFTGAYQNPTALNALYATQDNLYDGIDVGNMQRKSSTITDYPATTWAPTGNTLACEVREILSTNPDGTYNLGPSLTTGATADTDIQDLFNGTGTFTKADNGKGYQVKYYWSLNDGRYSSDDKIVTLDLDSTLKATGVNGKVKIDSTPASLDTETITAAAHSSHTVNYAPDTNYHFDSATVTITDGYSGPIYFDPAQPTKVFTDSDCTTELPNVTKSGDSITFSDITQDTEIEIQFEEDSHVYIDTTPGGNVAVNTTPPSTTQTSDSDYATGGIAYVTWALDSNPLYATYIYKGMTVQIGTGTAQNVYFDPTQPTKVFTDTAFTTELPNAVKDNNKITFSNVTEDIHVHVVYGPTSTTITLHVRQAVKGATLNSDGIMSTKSGTLAVPSNGYVKVTNVELDGSNNILSTGAVWNKVVNSGNENVLYTDFVVVNPSGFDGDTITGIIPMNYKLQKVTAKAGSADAETDVIADPYLLVTSTTDDEWWVTVWLEPSFVGPEPGYSIDNELNEFGQIDLS